MARIRVEPDGSVDKDPSGGGMTGKALFGISLIGIIFAFGTTPPAEKPSSPAPVEGQAVEPMVPDQRVLEQERITRRERAKPNLRFKSKQAPKPKPRAWGVVPTTNYRISSLYGWRWGRLHRGVDFAAPAGAPVFSVTGGVVKRASWFGGYGKAVVIDHGRVDTLYGHNSRLLVKPGQRVKRGQVIARIGSTGHSTGPHLHFEIHRGDRCFNPLLWLRERGVKL